MHHELDEGTRKNSILGAGTAPASGHGTPGNDAPNGDIQTSDATRNSDENGDNLRFTKRPLDRAKNHARRFEFGFTGPLFWMTMGCVFLVLIWAEMHQDELKSMVASINTPPQKKMMVSIAKTPVGTPWPATMRHATPRPDEIKRITEQAPTIIFKCIDSERTTYTNIPCDQQDQRLRNN
jgi:hypothetical protein